MAKPLELKIEDARLIFLNFSGRKGPYNAEGDRNFSVVLPDDVAETLLAEGWNVKYLQPRDEDDVPTPYLPVAVRFDPRPPRIVLLTSASKVQLDQESVDTLDNAQIATVDLIINGSKWEVQDKSGIKAYCKTMFVTIEEDDLERKYGFYNEE